jgi:hypothetical protein
MVDGLHGGPPPGDHHAMPPGDVEPLLDADDATMHAVHEGHSNKAYVAILFMFVMLTVRAPSPSPSSRFPPHNNPFPPRALPVSPPRRWTLLWTPSLWLAEGGGEAMRCHTAKRELTMRARALWPRDEARIALGALPEPCGAVAVRSLRREAACGSCPPEATLQQYMLRATLPEPLKSRFPPCASR